jgi:hypothetical protein
VTANYILGILGSLVILAALFEMMRRRRLREKHALLWIVVAAILVAVALVPGLLGHLAVLAHVDVPANLLFFGASVFLMLVSMQHSYEIGRLEEQTRTLAEEVALLRLELAQQTAQRPSLTDDGTE